MRLDDSSGLLIVLNWCNREYSLEISYEFHVSLKPKIHRYPRPWKEPERRQVSTCIHNHKSFPGKVDPEQQPLSLNRSLITWLNQICEGPCGRNSWRKTYHHTTTQDEGSHHLFVLSHRNNKFFYQINCNKHLSRISTEGEKSTLDKSFHPSINQPSYLWIYIYRIISSTKRRNSQVKPPTRISFLEPFLALLSFYTSS